MLIWKEFTAECAHSLPHVPAGHKCGRVHGHSYHITLFCEGPVDEKSGWVFDYADIAAAFQPILEELDHNHLNKLYGLENPTVENLARWIWKRLKGILPPLCRIQIRETCTAGVVYEGEE